MPLHLAGVHIDGKQRVAVEVVAMVRAAVVVVADLLDRYEQQAALHVDGEDSPQPWRVPALSTVVEPRRLIRIARLRLQIQRPPRLAGHRVPRLDGAVAALRYENVVVDTRAVTTPAVPESIRSHRTRDELARLRDRARQARSAVEVKSRGRKSVDSRASRSSPRRAVPVVSYFQICWPVTASSAYTPLPR